MRLRRPRHGSSSQACPPDAFEPLIEPLTAIVQGRRFVGVTALDAAVYESRRTCERDPRWTAPPDDTTAFDPLGSGP